MADTNVFQVSSTSSSSAAPSGVLAAPARVSAEAEIDQFFEELLNSSWSSGVVASAKTESKEGGSSSSAGTQAYEDQFDVEAHIAEDNRQPPVRMDQREPSKHKVQHFNISGKP